MGRIPKIIHKVFLQHSSEMVAIDHLAEGQKEALESWRVHNPEYEIRYYTHADCVWYLRTHFGSRYVDAYLKLKPLAFRCDFFRYCVVYQEGGWYSDWKQVAMQSLDAMNPFEKDLVFFKDKGNLHSFQHALVINGLFGAAPRNPVLFTAIRMCLENIEKERMGTNALYVTGPGVFTAAVFYQLDKLENNTEATHATACIDPSFPQPTGAFLKDDVTNLYFIYVQNAPVVLNKHQELSQNQDWKATGNNYVHMWDKKDIYTTKSRIVAMQGFVTHPEPTMACV